MSHINPSRRSGLPHWCAILVAAAGILATTCSGAAPRGELERIARPAAARDDAHRGGDKRFDGAQQAAASLPASVFSEPEPWWELLDKYGPSAVEWSLLPSFAAAPDPGGLRRPRPQAVRTAG